MGRPPRIHVPGRIHHVMTRGNGGQDIVTDPSDWPALRGLIAEVQRTSDFTLYAYCLMSNHLHLLVQANTVPVSKFMQRIKGSWARRFNWKRERKGHVFQGRFNSLPVDGDAYFRWLLRYIHLNPVRAGIVQRPEDWEWSSYRDYFQPVSFPMAETAWPLTLFGSARRPAETAFREFVLQGLTDDSPPPMPDSRIPTPKVERPSSRERSRPALDSIVAQIAAETVVPAGEFLGPRRESRICAARAMFARRAAVAGYGVAELAAALGMSTTAVSRMLRRTQRPPIAAASL